MSYHAKPRMRLNHAIGTGLAVGGMALGLGALAMAPGSTPHANATCATGLSAFSNTGSGSPNTINLGSGNNTNFQMGTINSGKNTSSTGNNTDNGNNSPTVCLMSPTGPFAFPNTSVFSNEGAGSPYTVNAFSGNNTNFQFGFPGGANLAENNSTTGNNMDNGNGSPTVHIGP